MIAGIDEAGRGPVLGPMVVAGVAVASDEALVRINVRDSKCLSPSRREQLAKKIGAIAKSEIIVVPAETIDSRCESLNDVEARLFAQLIERLKPTVVYADAVGPEESFSRKILSHLSYTPSVIAEHNADSRYPVVSAASILAKVRRDEGIRQIEGEIGEPIGSGYPADPITKKFLAGYVAKHNALPPHTRKSWATAKRLLQQKIL